MLVLSVAVIVIEWCVALGAASRVRTDPAVERLAPGLSRIVDYDYKHERRCAEQEWVGVFFELLLVLVLSEAVIVIEMGVAPGAASGFGPILQRSGLRRVPATIRLRLQARAPLR